MSYQPTQALGGGGRGSYTEEDTSRMVSAYARIAVGLNPFMAERPDALMALAQSGMPIEELINTSVGSYGLMLGNDFQEQLTGMSGAQQRALWPQVTKGQQMALTQMGYVPPERDDNDSWYSPVVGAAAAVGGVFMGGLNQLGVPGTDIDVSHGVSKTLDALQWSADRVGNLYRTIRIMDDRNQWQALAGAGLGIAAIAAAPITLGASLGSLAVIGAYGLGALGGASLAAGITNPFDFVRAFNESWDGERTFERGARRVADELLGDPRLIGLATDLALLDGLDLQELAMEIAGLKDGSDQNQMALLNQLAARLGEPNSRTYEQAFRSMLSVLEVPAFQAAVTALQDGKISPGRDLADMFQLDQDSTAHNLLSGSIDLAFQLAVDPTLMLGWGSKAKRAITNGVRLEEGGSFGAALKKVFARPRTRQLHELVVDAYNGVIHLPDGTKKATGIINTRALADISPQYAKLAPEITRYVASNPAKFKDGLTVEGLQEYLIGQGHLSPLLRGVGSTVYGNLVVVDDYRPIRESVRSAIKEFRAFTHGMSDPAMEKQVRERLEELGETEPGMMGILPKASQDYLTAEGLIESPWMLQHAGSRSYAAGRRVGEALPDFLPIGRFLEVATTMAPAGRAMKLSGDEAFDDIRAFTETGSFFGMPSYVRNAWADAIIQSPSGNARMLLAVSWLDNAMTISGGRSTEDFKYLTDEFIEKYRQQFGLGDQMMVAGAPRHVAMIVSQNADELVMPSLKQIRRYAQSGSLATLMGVTDLRVVDTAINRIWKPAVLLRLAFIPRAVGEEMLAFFLRGGIGGIVQDLGARSIADRKVWNEVYTKVQLKEVLTAAEREIYAQGRNLAIPAHVRWVQSIMDESGWADPMYKHLSNYGEFLDKALLHGSGKWRPQLRPENDTAFEVNNAFTARRAADDARAKARVGLPQWKINLSDQREAVLMGNKYSWRRMIGGGIDADAVDAAVEFRRLHQSSIMKSMSARTNADLEGTKGDPRYGKVETRTGPNGRPEVVQHVSSPGEAAISRIGEDEFDNHYLRMLQKYGEDPVIGPVLAQIMPKVKGNVTLTDSEIYDILAALRTLPPSVRGIMHEFLSGTHNNDAFQGMLRWLSGKHPEWAAILARMPTMRDMSFDDVVTHTKAYTADLARPWNDDREAEFAARALTMNDGTLVVDEPAWFQAMNRERRRYEQRQMMTVEQRKQYDVEHDPEGMIDQSAIDRDWQDYYRDQAWADGDDGIPGSRGNPDSDELPEIQKMLAADDGGGWADEFDQPGSWDTYDIDERGLPIDPNFPDAGPEYARALRDELDQAAYVDAEDARIEFGPEDAELREFRTTVLSQAEEEKAMFQEELLRLGGTSASLDARTGRPIFFMSPVGSKGGEWDWWKRLDPRKRRNISMNFFRRGDRSKAVSSIDVAASEMGLSVDDWAEVFMDTLERYQQSSARLRIYGRMNKRQLTDEWRTASSRALEEFTGSPMLSSAEGLAEGAMYRAKSTDDLFEEYGQYAGEEDNVADLDFTESNRVQELPLIELARRMSDNELRAAYTQWMAGPGADHQFLPEDPGPFLREVGAIRKGYPAETGSRALDEFTGGIPEAGTYQAKSTDDLFEEYGFYPDEAASEADIAAFQNNADLPLIELARRMSDSELRAAYTQWMAGPGAGSRILPEDPGMFLREIADIRTNYPAETASRAGSQIQSPVEMAAKLVPFDETLPTRATFDDRAATSAQASLAPRTNTPLDEESTAKAALANRQAMLERRRANQLKQRQDRARPWAEREDERRAAFADNGPPDEMTPEQIAIEERVPEDVWDRRKRLREEEAEERLQHQLMTEQTVDDSWWENMPEPTTVPAKLYEVEVDPEMFESFSRALEQIAPVMRTIAEMDHGTRGFIGTLIRNMDRPGSGIKLDDLARSLPSGTNQFFHTSFHDVHAELVDALISSAANPLHNSVIANQVRALTDLNQPYLRDATVQLYQAPAFSSVRKVLGKRGEELTFDMLVAQATNKAILQRNRDVVEAILNAEPGRIPVVADLRLAEELNAVMAKFGPRGVRQVHVVRVPEGMARNPGEGIGVEATLKGGERDSVRLWTLDGKMWGDRLETIPPTQAQRFREYAEGQAEEIVTWFSANSRATKKPRMGIDEEGNEVPLLFTLDVDGVKRPLTSEDRFDVDPVGVWDKNGKKVSPQDTAFWDIADSRPGEDAIPLWETIGVPMQDFADMRYGGERLIPKQQAMMASGQMLMSPDTVRVYRAKSEMMARGGDRRIPLAFGPRTEIQTIGAWDRFVRWGFDRVIGGTIDAMARRPMAFHYFKQRYVANRDLMRWMVDPDLDVKMIALRDQMKIERGSIHPRAVREMAADARTLAARMGAPSEAWTDADTFAWLRGHRPSEMADTIVQQYVHANAVSDQPAIDAYERLLAWEPKQLTSVSDFEINSQQLLKLIESQLPPGLLDKPAELFSIKGRKLIAENQVLALMTSDQWSTVMAFRANQKMIAKAASDGAAIGAINDMAPFIDSHEFKTQFGEYGKGFLPFWYAEENFLKRWVRGLALEGPAYIRKAQLGYMGLHSAGVIRTDESGRDWFVWPGSTQLADIVGKVFPSAGLAVSGLMFQTPTDAMLPGVNSRFGTPGFNPLVSVPVDVMSSFMPELAPIERMIEGSQEFGDRSLVELLVPTQATRFFEALLQDPDSSQKMMSAMNTAMAYRDANGQGLPDNATAGQRQQYLDEMQGHARIVILAQALAGFITPGPPSAVIAGESGGVLGTGIEEQSDVLTAEFTELVRGLGIEDGTMAYLARHKDATVYDVVRPLAYVQGGSATPSGARLGATNEALEWYDMNADYLDELPNAAPWLLPPTALEGRRVATAYEQQTSSGLRRRMSPGEFLNAMKFKEAASEYFWAKGLFDDKIALAAGANNDEEVRRLSARWDTHSLTFRTTHPLFDEEMSSGEGRQRRADVMKEMRIAIADPSAPASPHLNDLRGAMRLFDQYKANLALMGIDRSAKQRAEIEKMKVRYSGAMENIVNERPGLQSFWISVLRPEASLD